MISLMPSFEDESAADAHGVLLIGAGPPNSGRSMPVSR